MIVAGPRRIALINLPSYRRTRHRHTVNQTKMPKINGQDVGATGYGLMGKRLRIASTCERDG